MSEEQKPYKDASEYMVECVVPKEYLIDIDNEMSIKLDELKYNGIIKIPLSLFISLHEKAARSVYSDRPLREYKELLRAFPLNNQDGLKSESLSTLESLLSVSGTIMIIDKNISKLNFETSRMVSFLVFEGFTFSFTRFSGPLFKGARFVNCMFSVCEFSKSEFDSVAFIESHFICCTIKDESKFISCSFHKTKFTGSGYLSDYLPSNFLLSRYLMTVSGSDFSHSSFRDCQIGPDVEIRKSNLLMCKVSNTEIYDKLFFENNLYNASIESCVFYDANIHENCVWTGGHVSNDNENLNVPDRNFLRLSKLIDCKFIFCEINCTLSVECMTDIAFVELKNTNNIKLFRCELIQDVAIHESILNLFEIENSKCLSLNFSDSKIKEIMLNNSILQNLTFDLHTFNSIRRVKNGYKAANGIVFQKVYGAPNYAAEVKLLDRVDSGIGDDADTVVGNLEHSRRLYGVYLTVVAIGLVVLLKSYKVEGFESLTELPFVGKILGLELVPFLHFALFPGIILLMVASFVNEARRWLPFINKRKDVTKVTGFSWTITQYIEPHPLKGTERSWFSKYVKEFFKYPAWYSKKAVSLFIRSILIFCGPVVFTGLVYRCWECTTLPYEDYGTIIMAYHVVSLVFLLGAAFWLFWLSNQFQRPLAFNPDADSTANPAP